MFADEIPIAKIESMSNINTFLDDLRAKHADNPEALLAEIDTLLAKAKESEADFEARRTEAENSFVDATAFAQLQGATAPKLPESLVRLRESEAAAEHLVSQLSTARAQAWGHAAAKVGNELMTKAEEIAANYKAKVKAAVALVRMASLEYRNLTGNDFPALLATDGLPMRDVNTTAEAIARAEISELSDRGRQFERTIDHGFYLALGSLIDPAADKKARSIVTKTITQE